MKELFWTYKEFGGNLIVNPKSTIEDQIFELINNALIEKKELPLVDFKENEIKIKSQRIK